MKVSILGLGIIGEIWARNLAHDGLLAATWNRTEKPQFPCWHKSAADAARAGDMIIIVVADPAAVESVLEDILPVLDETKTIVQSSTIDPESSMRFRLMVGTSGASYLEAPFTGSKPAAEARKTVFYLGGDDGLIARVSPVLEKISQRIFNVGTNEQAATLKLSMNLQIAAQAQALCESIKMIRAAGIPDDVYFDCMSINVARSGLTDLKEPKLRTADYSPQFSIKHMHKDLRLALSGDRKMFLPLTEKVRELFAQAEEAGFSEEDFISLYKLL